MTKGVPSALACNKVASDFLYKELQAGGNDKSVLLIILLTVFHMDPKFSSA